MSAITSSANAALMFLPLDQLEANEFALRTVDAEDPYVLSLFDNIAARGVQKPIGVRPSFLADKKTPKVTADGRHIYNVKDGLHRFSGALRAKLKEVAVIVQDADDAQVRLDQIMDNLHVIPTKPFEYGKALKVVLSSDPTMTLAELGRKLNVNVEFLEKRMGLSGLHKDGVDKDGEPTSTIGDIVDKGDICLGNAVELAKLKPTEEQLSYVKDAIEMPTLQFAKKIKDRIKFIRDEKQKGREPGVRVATFTPSAHFRKKTLVEIELKSMTELSLILKSKGITDPVEAARFALNWALHLDEQSIAHQKADWDAREAERLAKLQAAKAERLKKQSDEADAALKKVEAANPN